MFRKADLCSASGGLLDVTASDKNHLHARLTANAANAPIPHNPNLFAQPTQPHPAQSPTSEKTLGRVFTK